MLDDPQAMASELSETELTCLAGVADPRRLLQIFTDPDPATPEEQGQLVGCLEDETLLRIFIAGFLSDSGPLSEETSACIRTRFEGLDLRPVMLAGAQGEEQDAAGGAEFIAGFFITLACLNQEEWAAAAPALDMDPGDQESAMCVLERMGGPEGMVAVLGEDAETGAMALFGTVVECGLEDGPEPAKQTPTPAPTATPAPATGPKPGAPCTSTSAR